MDCLFHIFFIPSLSLLKSDGAVDFWDGLNMEGVCTLPRESMPHPCDHCGEKMLPMWVYLNWGMARGWFSSEEGGMFPEMHQPSNHVVYVQMTLHSWSWYVICLLSLIFVSTVCNCFLYLIKLYGSNVLGVCAFMCVFLQSHSTTFFSTIRLQSFVLNDSQCYSTPSLSIIGPGVLLHWMDHTLILEWHSMQL